VKFKRSLSVVQKAFLCLLTDGASPLLESYMLLFPVKMCTLHPILHFTLFCALNYWMVVNEGLERVWMEVVMA
jgi:hypothetical protein